MVTGFIRSSGFNPRSHEGSDESGSGSFFIAGKVSIHAPMKGATHFSHSFHHLIGVSIHAPMKGATVLSYHLLYISSCFNPRSHEGSDKGLPVTGQAFRVSIHAPMKGATNQVSTLAVSRIVSIHAPMKGATSMRCRSISSW